MAEWGRCLALPHQSSGADTRAALHSEDFTFYISCNIPLSCAKERPCGRATLGREKGASTQLLSTAWEVFYIKLGEGSFLYMRGWWHSHSCTALWVTSEALIPPLFHHAHTGEVSGRMAPLLLFPLSEGTLGYRHPLLKQ